MELRIVTRDVMNTKSSMKRRHAVKYNDWSLLKDWYAIESRLYLSYQEVLDNGAVALRHVSELWFTNELVFDYDLHDEDVKSKEQANALVDEFLNKLEALLGKPRWIITNKNEYTQWQIDRYFTLYTEDGTKEVKLPKKYGCQVIYELDESLKSQMLERVKLYQKARLKVTEMVGADLNFRGHMHKNQWNRGIFNIVVNDDGDVVSLKKLASVAGFDEKLVNDVLSLPAFHSFEKKLPVIFAKYQRRLNQWYQELNTWKRPFKQNINTSAVQPQKWMKSSSRNVTLFNYLSCVPSAQLEAMNLETIACKQNLFGHCDIQEPLDLDECETVRNSILQWRDANGFEPDGNDIQDNRVLKLDSYLQDLNIVEKWKTMIPLKQQNEVYVTFDRKYGRGISHRKFSIKTKNGQESVEYSIFNLMLSIGPMEILEHVNSLIQPEFIHLVEEKCNCSLGLDDAYHAIRTALFMLHWSVINGIRSCSTLPVEKKVVHSTRMQQNSMITRYGVHKRGSYVSTSTIISDAIKFKKYYLKLLRNGHLKENGIPKPISYYQQLFHCSCSTASIYVKTIKVFLHIYYILTKKFKQNTSKRFEHLIKVLHIPTRRYNSNVVVLSLKYYLKIHILGNNDTKYLFVYTKYSSKPKCSTKPKYFFIYIKDKTIPKCSNKPKYSSSSIPDSKKDCAFSLLPPKR